MIKHISQLASLADYKKACGSDGKTLSDKPTPFAFFPKFAFSKTSTGPVLLLGSVPSTIMSEARKQGGVCITGKASLNKQGMIALEGTSAKVDSSAIQQGFAAIGVPKKIAGGTDETQEGTPKSPAKKFPDPLTTPQADTSLKTKALGSSFEGEETKMGWRARGDPDRAETDTVTTLYANENLRKNLEIGFDGKGHLIDSSGDRISKQSIGFVGNPETGGGLHQFDPSLTLRTRDGKFKRVHHSTPLAGKPVTGAGMIETNRKGHITEITDQSGHYKPGEELTFQTVKAMGKDKDAEGFDKNLTDRRTDADGEPKNRPAKVTLVGKQGLDDADWNSVKGDPAGINALLAKRFGAGVQLSESELNGATHESVNIAISQKTSVSVTSQQYLQTEGNEKGIRAKKSLTKELHSKISRVKSSENADIEQGDARMTIAQMRKLGINPVETRGITAKAAPRTPDSPKSAKKPSTQASKGRKPAARQQPMAPQDARRRGTTDQSDGPVPGANAATVPYTSDGEFQPEEDRSEAQQDRGVATGRESAPVNSVTNDEIGSRLRGEAKNPNAYKPVNPETM